MTVKIHVRYVKRMASFLNILKSTLGFVTKEAPVISTGLSMINPAAGAIFNAVLTGVNKAETIFTQPKAGAQKSDMVISEFENGLQVAADIFAARGEQLTYDKAALQQLIDAQVAALNALAKVKASITTKPTGAPVPPTPAPLPPLAPVQTQPAPSLTQASIFADGVKIVGL